LLASNSEVGRVSSPASLGPFLSAKLETSLASAW